MKSLSWKLVSFWLTSLLFLGVFSLLTSQPTFAQGGIGLRGEYYEWDPSLGGTPDRLDVFKPENLKVVRLDPVVNFGWGGGQPDPEVRADQFGVRWRGQIMAPETGEYTFSIVGDDGIVLWLSDKPIDVNNPGDPITDPGGWRLQGDTEYLSQPVKLEKGKKYYVLFEMYENGGGATARLRWQGPGIDKQPIPTQYLFPLKDDPNDVTPPDSITDLAVTETSLTTVTLTWTAPGGDPYRYEVRWSYSPITPDNFDSAFPAVGVPKPGAKGTKETFKVTGLQPIQNYYFAMRVWDKNFNVSGLSNVVSAQTPGGSFGDGLKGEYYEWDPSLGGTPDRLDVFKPENLKLVRIDPVVNFGWGGGQPAPTVRADQFAVRWTGWVEAPSSEEFTFSIVGDDGVVLWLSDKQFDPNNPPEPITDPGGWKLQGDTEYLSQPIKLEKGKKYFIMFEMYENGGGATARLRWESPSIPKQPISQVYLFSTGQPVSLGRLSGVVTNPLKQPIANAVVNVTIGNSKNSATTDANGFYTLLVPEGKAEVTANPGGPLSDIQTQGTADIKANQITRLDLTISLLELGRMSLRSADLKKAGRPGWRFLGTTSEDSSVFEGMAPDFKDYIDPNYKDTGTDKLIPSATWVEDWDLVPGDAGPRGRAGEPGGIPDNTYWVQRLHFTLPPELEKAEFFVLRDFNLDDRNEITAVNGVKVEGQPGVWQWDRNWIIRIPGDIVKRGGQENVLTIVGFEGGGGAGHNLDYGGPVLVGYTTKVEAPPTPGPPAAVCGDANGDGKVAVADAILALQVAVGTRKATDAQLAALDLNGDGRVTIAEVIPILRKAVNPAFALTGKNCK